MRSTPSPRGSIELFSAAIFERPPVSHVRFSKGLSMAEKDVIERAHRDAQEGKSPSTQAGEFVREEIEHVREGKHGARSVQQAIAIGLSKARRSEVKLPPPKKGRTSQQVRRQAQRDLSEARSRRKKKPSVKRSRATSNALRRESRGSVSHAALSRQARSSARRRGSAERPRAARAAVRAKGRTGRQKATAKAARTRQRRG